MKKLDHTILIVRPEGFWSSWLGATRRIMFVAKLFHSKGWEVILLASRRSKSKADLIQEAAFPGKVIRTTFTGGYPYLFDLFEGLRRLYRLMWRLRGKTYYIRKLELGWAFRLQSWVGLDQIIRKPSVIWAISTGSMGGLIGGTFLSRFFSCPLIVEIQDPVLYSISEYSDPTLENQINDCYHESAAIITVTNTLADYLKFNYPKNESKIHTVHLSFDEEKKPSDRERNDGKLVLLHAGALAGGVGRNARALIQGIAEVSLIEPSAKGKIELKLLGAGKGADEAAKIAENYKLSNIVMILPECSLEDAYREMDLSDVLVVIKYDNANFDMQIPGKLFQYLGRGKPILGIMRKTEAAEILIQSGIGIVVGHDSKVIAESILNLWNNRDRLRAVFKPDWRYINQFSGVNTRIKISKILDGVL